MIWLFRNIWCSDVCVIQVSHIHANIQIHNIQNTIHKHPINRPSVRYAYPPTVSACSVKSFYPHSPATWLRRTMNNELYIHRSGVVAWVANMLRYLYAMQRGGCPSLGISWPTKLASHGQHTVNTHCRAAITLLGWVGGYFDLTHRVFQGIAWSHARYLGTPRV
jgi:hypothetical protein